MIFIMNVWVVLIVFVACAEAVEHGPYPATSSDQGNIQSDYMYKSRIHRNVQPQRSETPETRQKYGVEHTINQAPYRPKSQQKQTINSYVNTYPLKQPDVGPLRQREHGYIGNSRPRVTEEIARRRSHGSAKQTHTTSTIYKQKPAESMQSHGFPFNYRGFPYNYFGFPYGNKYKFGYQAEAFPLNENKGTWTF